MKTVITVDLPTGSQPTLEDVRQLLHERDSLVEEVAELEKIYNTALQIISDMREGIESLSNRPSSVAEMNAEFERLEREELQKTAARLGYSLVWPGDEGSGP